MTMRTIILLSVLSLAACAPINTYMAGQNAAIIADTKAANDNAVVGIEAAICEVPIGAVIRNAEFVPIATAACMPGGAAGSAGAMIQQMGAQTTAPVIPAYQQTINAISAQTPVVPVAPAIHVQRTTPVPKIRKKAIIPQSQASPIAQPIALPIPVPNALGNAPNASGNAPKSVPAFGTLTKNPNFPN